MTRVKRQPGRPAKAARVVERFARVNGVRLRYVVAGQGHRGGAAARLPAIAEFVA